MLELRPCDGTAKERGLSTFSRAAQKIELTFESHATNQGKSTRQARKQITQVRVKRVKKINPLLLC